MVKSTLYHRSIAYNGIPFSLSFSNQPKSSEEMMTAQLDAKLQRSYKQARSRQGRPMVDVFDAIERKHI